MDMHMYYYTTTCIYAHNKLKISPFSLNADLISLQYLVSACTLFLSYANLPFLGNTDRPGGRGYKLSSFFHNSLNKGSITASGLENITTIINRTSQQNYNSQRVQSTIIPRKIMVGHIVQACSVLSKKNFLDTAMNHNTIIAL